MAFPNDETRRQCGDVLLVGGTFYLAGAKLVLGNGVSFSVDVNLKISQRSGITFPKVKLAASTRASGQQPQMEARPAQDGSTKKGL